MQHENSSNTCLPRQKETRGANVVVCGTDESKRGRKREWVGTSTNNNTFYRSKIIYSLSPVNKFRGTGRSTEQLHPYTHKLHPNGELAVIIEGNWVTHIDSMGNIPVGMVNYLLHWQDGSTQ